MRRFGDCAAVVTGGGSGIGEAVVRGLVAEGASVVVVDVNQAAAQSGSPTVWVSGGRPAPRRWTLATARASMRS